MFVNGVGVRLWHMRVKKGGDVKITLISRAQEAAAAAEKDGTYLELYDTAVMLYEDVPSRSLHGFRKNVATAFEATVAKAASLDPTLSQTYGRGILLGTGIVFSVEKGSAFVEIDGLVLHADTSMLACVEAKTHLHADDLTKMAATRKKLALVLDNPTIFSSEPEDVLERIALRGLTIVAVAGTRICDDGVAAHCIRSGIHLLLPSGSGFACMLASDVVAEVTASRSGSGKASNSH